MPIKWSFVVQRGDGVAQDVEVVFEEASQITLDVLKLRLNMQKSDLLLVRDNNNNSDILVSSEKQFEIIHNKSHLRIMDSTVFEKETNNAKRLSKHEANIGSPEEIHIQRTRSDIFAFLEIKLLEARNLFPMDISGTSDSYCMLKMNDGDLLFKSGVQWKTLSPKWDETFYFPIGLSDNPKLLLSCFDTDETVRFRDDFIGSFELPVSKFLDFKKHDDWYGLTLTEKGTTKNRGEIRLLISMKNKQEANSPLFGSPLELNLTIGTTIHDIPPTIERMISEIESRGMKTEGLGRLAASRQEIEQTKIDLNNGKEIDFSKLHDLLLCDLLKNYLRELPQPLVPYESYDQLLDLWRTGPRTEQTRMMSLLNRTLNKLPKTNKQLLLRLLKFWFQISQNQSENKMTAKNISVVFCPNIMYRTSDKLIQMAAEYNEVIELFAFLIENQNKVRVLTSDHASLSLRGTKK